MLCGRGIHSCPFFNVSSWWQSFLRCCCLRSGPLVVFFSWKYSNSYASPVLTEFSGFFSSENLFSSKRTCSRVLFPLKTSFLLKGSAPFHFAFSKISFRRGRIDILCHSETELLSHQWQSLVSMNSPMYQWTVPNN